MNILRGLLALCLIVWNLQLMLLGFVLIAFAPTKDTVGILSDEWGPRTDWKWRLLQWLLGNNEDGLDGLRSGQSGPNGGTVYKNPNWVAATSGWGRRRRIWVWSAWRNSVNNLRFTALGRSPEYSAELPKFENAFLTSGVKFFLQLTLSKAAPYRVLWFGWKPGAGFKSTVTTLDKVGA